MLKVTIKGPLLTSYYQVIIFTIRSFQPAAKQSTPQKGLAPPLCLSPAPTASALFASGTCDPLWRCRHPSRHPKAAYIPATPELGTQLTLGHVTKIPAKPQPLTLDCSSPPTTPLHVERTADDPPSCCTDSAGRTAVHYKELI